MKRYRQPIFFTLSALSSVLVDLGLFYVLHLLLADALGDFAEALCTVLARAISSFWNFNLNRSMVFRSSDAYGKAMLRYYCLALPQGAASTVLLTLFTQLLGVESSVGTTLLKAAVDSGLFVASFFIQKFWVFPQKKQKNENNASV